MSKGCWKASVIRSYELAERRITVSGLAELARLYGVRAEELLPSTKVPTRDSSPQGIAIDLVQLGKLPIDEVGPLKRYAAAIQSQRRDGGGMTMIVRRQDMSTLAVICGIATESLITKLADCGVITINGSFHLPDISASPPAKG